MENGFRGLLCGPPGIAKTSLITAAAESAGFTVEVTRASLSERIDYGGCLVPDIANGVTRSLPLEMLERLQKTGEKTLLFLDDLGQAPLDVQAAIMRLFDSGFFPQNVLIWGATNRPQDKAGVCGLCEPLRSRFHFAFNMATPEGAVHANAVTLGTWKESVEGWTEWLSQNGGSPEVIAYHLANNGKNLYAWKPSNDPSERQPDFRSWETLDKAFRSGLSDMNSLSAIIGKAVASEFLAYSRLRDQLPSMEEILKNPNGCAIPQNAPDACYLTVVMLSQYIQHAWGSAIVKRQEAMEKNTKVEDIKLSPEETRNGEAVITYVSRIPVHFSAFFFKTVFHKLGSLVGKVPAFKKWFLENKDVFGDK